MIKIGITGQKGFIGTHLFNYLGLHECVKRIPFEDEYFKNEITLQNYVKACDVIVHLAALNRHDDPQILYEINIELVKKLISACEKTDSTPHILYSSSTQEKQGNLYGKSKYEGRELLERWANKNHAQFTGLIIPNVYGPFGVPYYNSFIATFCHQLTSSEEPKIDIDGEVKLIFVGELVVKIYDQILAKKNDEVNGIPIREVNIEHTAQKRVSEVLKLLLEYKQNYYENGVIPNLTDQFERNLFNTFVNYIDHNIFFPFRLSKHADYRGEFVEIIKLNSGGQVSFSTTAPNITRGNHYHTRKYERFAVLKGRARLQLRKIGTNQVIDFELDGNEPCFVDIPIWHTHNIQNIGSDELYTIFWISEQYDPEDDDTYHEIV
jgi:UDP-2-acetamido-2,6-beta-L-arabino-hexul-4-ose reductase